VVAAIAAKAMEAELALGADAPVPLLRSFHGVFAGQVPAGPVEVDVAVLRRGRSMSQVQATVHPRGTDVGFTALAVFGGPRRGFEFTDLVMPEVDPPELCQSFRDPPPPDVDWEPWDPLPFWDEVLEGRNALGHPPWERVERDTAENGVWFRFEQPPVAEDGLMDPYAMFVMGDVMPGAVFERIGRTEERWFSPSVDLTVHLFGRATPGWIFGHNRARHAGDGYASLDMALWDPRGPDGPVLVAYATQQAFFTSFVPSPPSSP
jgi:acyl-CoA thioesterase